MHRLEQNMQYGLTSFRHSESEIIALNAFTPLNIVVSASDPSKPPTGTPVRKQRPERYAETTLDALLEHDDPVTGIKDFAAYIAALGVATTPLHGEQFQLGSSLMMQHARRIGNQKTGAKGGKVWICLANAEKARPGLERICARSEFR